MSIPDTEDLKIFACDIIQNAGILLRIPQVAMSTAQMLLHRVYQTKDYTVDLYPIDITGMAALFLAAKIEECPRKSRDVMSVFSYVIASKLKCRIDTRHSDDERIREELITAERRLLRNLGFNLLSSYPHKLLLSYYQAVVNQLDPEYMHWSLQMNQRLLQLAWNYCNDSLRLDIFIKYSEEAVACACIQMACEKTGMLFPKSTDGREWYQLFVDDSKEVEGAILMLINLYKRNTPDPQDFKRYLYMYKFRSHH